jgi:hypothetical protein
MWMPRWDRAHMLSLPLPPLSLWTPSMADKSSWRFQSQGLWAAMDSSEAQNRESRWRGSRGGPHLRRGVRHRPEYGRRRGSKATGGQLRCAWWRRSGGPLTPGTSLGCVARRRGRCGVTSLLREWAEATLGDSRRLWLGALAAVLVWGREARNKEQGLRGLGLRPAAASRRGSAIRLAPPPPAIFQLAPPLTTAAKDLNEIPFTCSLGPTLHSSP